MWSRYKRRAGSPCWPFSSCFSGSVYLFRKKNRLTDLQQTIDTPLSPTRHNELQNYPSPRRLHLHRFGGKHLLGCQIQQHRGQRQRCRLSTRRCRHQLWFPWFRPGLHFELQRSRPAAHARHGCPAVLQSLWRLRESQR